MMLNCLSLLYINKIIKTLLSDYQQSMRQLKVVGLASSMLRGLRGRQISNMIRKPCMLAFSKVIMPPYSLVYKQVYHSSTLKVNYQARKILQISDSILPPLFQKQDYLTILQFLRQIAIIFVSSLDSTSKEESKKVLNRIVQIAIQVQQKVTNLEQQSFLATLKLLSDNVDQINDTALIIDFDELHIHFLKKFKKEDSVDYLKMLAKMMEDCISAQQPQKGIQAYNEIASIIKKSTTILDIPLKIEIEINCAILQLISSLIPEAIDSYNAALKFCRQNQGKQVESHEIVILQCLGDIMKEQSNFEEAINYYKESLAISQTYFEKINVNSAILQYKINKSYFSLQKYENVIDHCKKIEEMISKYDDIRDEFEYQNQVILMLAQSYEKIGLLESSIAYLDKYLSIVEKAIIIDERSYIQSQQRLSQIYERINKSSQSEQCLRKIVRYYKIQGDQQRQEEYKHKIALLK